MKPADMKLQQFIKQQDEVDDSRGKIFQFRMSAELHAAIKKRARREGTTITNLLELAIADRLKKKVEDED